MIDQLASLPCMLPALPAGAVVLRPGAALGEQELLAWMEGRVARYKLPKRAFFWDELPKSGYGKVTKKIVRETLGARGCLPAVAVPLEPARSAASA